MSSVKVTVVTDPNCNFQAVYLDGRLIADIGDNATARIDTSYFSIDDMLDALFDQPELRDLVEYETIGGYQLAEKIVGFDYVEWDGYWPAELSKVPRDTTDYSEGATSDDVR